MELRKYEIKRSIRITIECFNYSNVETYTGDSLTVPSLECHIDYPGDDDMAILEFKCVKCKAEQRIVL